MASMNFSSQRMVDSQMILQLVVQPIVAFLGCLVSTVFLIASLRLKVDSILRLQAVGCWVYSLAAIFAVVLPAFIRWFTEERTSSSFDECILGGGCVAFQVLSVFQFVLQLLALAFVVCLPPDTTLMRFAVLLILLLSSVLTFLPFELHYSVCFSTTDYPFRVRLPAILLFVCCVFLILTTFGRAVLLLMPKEAQRSRDIRGLKKTLASPMFVRICAVLIITLNIPVYLVVSPFTQKHILRVQCTNLVVNEVSFALVLPTLLWFSRNHRKANQRGRHLHRDSAVGCISLGHSLVVPAVASATTPSETSRSHSHRPTSPASTVHDEAPVINIVPPDDEKDDEELSSPTISWYRIERMTGPRLSDTLSTEAPFHVVGPDISKKPRRLSRNRRFFWP